MGGIMHLARLIFVLLASAAGAPVLAQAVEEETEIIVTGQIQRGAVVGDIKPELQLSPADIRSRGVSSVSELIADLAPQLRSGSGNGQPIVLLEGKRISGFREVANLPSEAIARVDILPEEVALKYGYPSGQKVVNIVLRQRFRAFTVELSDRFATGGGGNQTLGKFDFLRIQRGGRFTVNLEREAVDRILESQRGINDNAGSGQFRTLVPASEKFTLGTTLSRTIFDDITATINGELKTEDSRATFGSPTGGGSPPGRTNGSQSAHAGATLNGTVADWRWTFTGNYDHVEAKSLIDRGIGPVTDQARSVSDIAAVDFVANGALLKLPAGDVSSTLKVGASFSGFSAKSVRGGVLQAGRVTRDIADAQLNIDVPLTSRKDDVVAILGDLSINGNYAARRLSDFGSLRTLGYGLNWSPLKSLSLIASVTEDEVAPTAQQLGNPVVSTPDVRVFDFVRGETALVTQITGGNRALLPSDRHVFKLAATLKPFEKPDITLNGDYTLTQTKGGLAALPPASLASQAAFPDRYVRDAGGALVRVDSRSVNFARADASQFRWGINFSQPLKTSQAQIDAMRAAFQSRFPNGPPRGQSEGQRGQRGSSGGGPGGGFGGGGGGPGGGGGRLNFAVYHTVHITNSVTLRDGLPVVDLLNGGTIGSGGQPRHEIEVQAGLAKNGFGARITGDWKRATRVTGSVAADDLRFSDLATVNLRLFANIGQLPWAIKSAPWLRGTRISLGVNNLFDARQRVTDGTGATPVGYLPGYLDPFGRTVRLTIRKMLF
jgi:iron complex outermembrane recepter protein